MGLLDTNFSTVSASRPQKSDRILPREKMNVRGLLDAATAIPVAGDLLSGGLAAYDAAKGDYGSAAMNALGVLPFIPGFGAVTAWHGSPHKFNKFDMSKIGTGEGAQAYGHGLYMAEAPETAQMYRASVQNGPAFGLEDGPTKGIATLLAAKGSKGEEMARKAYANLGESLEPTIAKAREAVDSQSHLYKVDIPDEAVAKFLDWDKPLSQQAPEVQSALKKGGIQLEDSSMLSGDDALKSFFGAEDYVPHGESLYRHLGDNDVATKKLLELGIPGIRYLDGGSRGAGAGTSNYVLFDDKLPRILETNGKPTGLQPWAKGELEGLLGK